jgi:hypothetical protein
MQDYISMVILWYATDMKQRGAGESALKEISTSFDLLESVLDKALEKKS